jgi:hypothetical protein
MITVAMLCGHEFDTDSFQNYPDDYAGYCPDCIKALEEADDNFSDVDLEPDGNGIPQFNGDSFSEDDDEDYDTDVALDDYAEEENIEDDDIDPMAEETQEDFDREEKQLAEEIANSLDSIYKPSMQNLGIGNSALNIEIPFGMSSNMVFKRGLQTDPASDLLDAFKI